MAEQDRPAVGTVAQEAARLLDALGEWAHTTTDHSTTDHSTTDRSTTDHSTTDHSTTDQPGGEGDSTRERAGGDRCERCGSETGVGRAVVCRLCPICQGIGLLRTVRPETVDRLADLAGAVTTALRDLAASQRGAASANKTRDQGPARTAAPVQDITIEDEESGAP